MAGTRYDRVPEMLDERKAAILRAVVEEYIETAQPVGSAPCRLRDRGRGLARPPSATRWPSSSSEGYLVQPHTSAGRIPTDKGYRFFVDYLVPGRACSIPAERQQVREFFARHPRRDRADAARHQPAAVRPHRLRRRGRRARPSATGCRPVGAARRPRTPQSCCWSWCCRTARSRSAPSSSRTTWARRSSAAADAHLAAHLVGRPYAEVSTSPPTGNARGRRHGDCRDLQRCVRHAGRRRRAGVRRRRVAAWRGVRRGGDRAPGAGILEQQYVVVTLLRDVLDRGLPWPSAPRHGMEPLAECSRRGRAVRDRGRDRPAPSACSARPA